jgi:hypothetical protein
MKKGDEKTSNFSNTFAKLLRVVIVLLVLSLVIDIWFYLVGGGRGYYGIFAFILFLVLLTTLLFLVLNRRRYLSRVFHTIK